MEHILKLNIVKRDHLKIHLVDIANLFMLYLEWDNSSEGLLSIATLSMQHNE